MKLVKDIVTDELQLSERAVEIDVRTQATEMREIIKGTTIIISHQERILNIADQIVLLKSGQDISAQSRLVKYVKDITNWVQQGNNLYIHSSNCGNGKTAWSIKFIQEYIKAIWAKADVEDCRALFVSVPKFLIESKRSIGEFSEYADTVKKRVANADLVVWDEIGSKAGTEYEIEILLNIINDRINNGKANIYTSNLPEDTLRVCLGERLYSRIVNLSDVCEFKNNDLRGKFKK